MPSSLQRSMSAVLLNPESARSRITVLGRSALMHSTRGEAPRACLAAVNCAVVHADRIALDEGQQRQIAVAIVVRVEFSSFLKTMGFDGRVVHVDDEDLFAGAVAKKEVPQKFIASVEQLLRNLALKSVERGAGGQHIAHSSPKASINGKEIVIIEILVSRHQGIEALFDEILVRVKIGSGRLRGTNSLKTVAETCKKFIEEAALGEPVLAKNEAGVLEDRSGFLGNTNFASQRKLFKNPCSQAELNKIVPFGFSLQRQKMVFFCHQNSIILLC